MSTPEYTPQESRSSVAVSMNAKGEAIVTVKVYEGTPEGDLDATRALAVRTYLDTVKAVRAPVGMAT